jgi:hypothetical protein
MENDEGRPAGNPSDGAEGKREHNPAGNGADGGALARRLRAAPIGHAKARTVVAGVLVLVGVGVHVYAPGLEPFGFAATMAACWACALASLPIFVAYGDDERGWAWLGLSFIMACGASLFTLLHGWGYAGVIPIMVFFGWLVVLFVVEAIQINRSIAESRQRHEERQRNPHTHSGGG